MHLRRMGLLALGLSLAATGAQTESLRVVVLGDMPYSSTEERALAGPIRQTIVTTRPAFVVHIGDFKNGQTSCTDGLLTERRDQIYGLLPGRVFYTPGDNEWADCDRSVLDNPMSELSRFAYLRRIFFDERPMDLPAAWAYQRQDLFPENARWRQNNVLFVTLHWIGTGNGRKQVLRDDGDLAMALVEAREQANRVWLDAAFQSAKWTRAGALVVLTQADSTAETGKPHCAKGHDEGCDPFAAFRTQLVARAGEFGRPVLLVHGDTAPYCWDKRFGGETAPNLWRLNAWGDFRTPPDATEIAIDAANGAEPFAAITLLGRRLPDVRC
ncbi:hypothetical protein [Paludibacterium purpuratum]|nr:hypothetical protein [Paludibacterium purpuratum]